ncbi:MAG: hypothetical protein ACJAXV_000329 [Bacteroidia bacterium]|jgi:hypothetical protein
MANTSEQTLEDYIEKYGDELGKSFYYIKKEVIRINHLWSEFKILYVSGEKSIEILNACAPSFFEIIRDSMIRDLTISILRLAEPSEINGWKNVTTERVLNLIDNTQVTRDDQELLIKFKESTNPLKPFRDKFYGHNSYEAIVEGKVKFPKYGKDELTYAIESMNGLFNVLFKHITGIGLILTHVSPDNAKSLLVRLEHSCRYQEKYFEAMRKGETFDDDFHVKELNF